MHRFLRYIAVLLLMLFVRAMVPDALLLELHAHTHTVHTDQTDNHKAQVGQKHKHCPVEDFFGAPFQGSVNPVDFTLLTHTSEYNSCYSSNYHNNFFNYTSLRGPPLS